MPQLKRHAIAVVRPVDVRRKGNVVVVNITRAPPM
jgi:hypothetical protein